MFFSKETDHYGITLYSVLELQWRQAPPCSSWDTGREVPFVLVLLTDGKPLSIFLLVTHGQNVNLSFECDAI